MQANNFYSDLFELNRREFADSLWTVGGRPSPSQYVPCGRGLSAYTYIGPIAPFEPVTRIFANMEQHLSFSISFNIFGVDFPLASRNSKFEIYLNDNLYDIKYLVVPAISDLCGTSAPEAFLTFPPTPFYQDTNNNLNLTIIADTFWGIRDLRLVLQKCDSNCLNCGPSGCLQCSGLLQLTNGQWTGCPLGFGTNSAFVPGQNGYCYRCQDKCLNCIFNNSANSSNCQLCSAPFYLYKGQCILRTNIGGILPAPALSLPPGSQAPLPTCSLPPAFVSNGTNSTNSSNGSFTLSSSTLTSQLNVPERHYKQIVEFYLVRVGQWQPSDRLDVYLNDLLLLSKTYSSFGNQICSSPTNTTDFISF